MKVRFENVEIDIWKLKRGTVLLIDNEYVYLEKFKNYGNIFVINSDGYASTYKRESVDYTWIEPH